MKEFIKSALASSIEAAVPPGLALMDFQYSGVEFLAKRKRALIASDPGLGKTVMNIVAVNCLQKHMNRPLKMLPPVALKVLVLCPKGMVITWQREIDKWSMGGHYTIANWDKLVHLNDKRKEVLFTKWDLIIGDESHQAIKNPDTVRCMVFFNELVPLAGRVWIATATPASRSGLDYYCTLKLLLPKLFEKWSAKQFEREFCEAIPEGKGWNGKEWYTIYRYEGFKNTVILKELFSKCCIRHKKEVVAKDLPEKIFTEMEVEIDKRIAAQYLEMDIEQVMECIEKNKPIPAHMAHVMQATALAKLNDLVDLVESYPPDISVVIFAWHRNVVEEIAKRLDCPYIHGEVSSDERQIVIDKFQKKELNRLTANMQSGGVGITLTAASICIYVEFPHSVIHWKQSLGRIHRIGSKHTHVQFIKMIGRNTIDREIFNRLQAREKSMEQVGV